MHAWMRGETNQMPHVCDMIYAIGEVMNMHLHQQERTRVMHTCIFSFRALRHFVLELLNSTTQINVI